MHKAALDHIQNRWNAASDTWNIKALAQIYTHDALFFGLLPKLYIGRSEIEDYFASYQISLKRVTLTLVDQTLRPLGDAVFAAQGFGDIVNYYRDGSVIKNRVRSSFVIVNNVGEWQISLHHFSDLIQEKP